MDRVRSAVVEARRRAVGYWNIDGLPQIAAGLGQIPLSLCLLYYKDSWIFFLALVLSFFLLRTKTIEWMKARITYPRTGYVPPPESYPEERYRETESDLTAPPRGDEIDRSAVALTLTVLVMVALLPTAWPCGVVGIAILAILWRQWHNEELAGARILMLGCAGAGLVIAIGSVGRNQRLGVAGVAFGTINLIVGMSRFVYYVRRHPASRA